MSSNDVPLLALARRRMPYILAFIALFVFFALTWSILDETNSRITRGVTGTLGDPRRHWGFDATYLLMTLPLGAAVVVFVRMILGWQTFGLFTPMLLALAYLQTGPLLGPTISTAAILIGMTAAPLLKRLELARVAFLGALIAIVVTALLFIARQTQNQEFITAFPIVVTALVVERWWAAWEAEGLRKALKFTGYTLIVALAIQAIIALPILVHFAERAPELLPALAGIAIIAMGKYKGLRLSELGRFKPVTGADNGN